MPTNDPPEHDWDWHTLRCLSCFIDLYDFSQSLAPCRGPGDEPDPHGDIREVQPGTTEGDYFRRVNGG